MPEKPRWKGRAPRKERCSECRERYRTEWLMQESGEFYCYPSCNESARKHRLNELNAHLVVDPVQQFTLVKNPFDKNDFSG